MIDAMGNEECEHCGQSTDGIVQQVALDALKRIDELESEDAKLRAALEEAAEKFNGLRMHLTGYGARGEAVDAMRACWTALGKWPPKDSES